jgi:hypothetical protein
MRLSWKIMLLCLALALPLTTAAAANAGARKSRVGSDNTLQSVGPDGASGHVSSDRRECRAQRRVAFYRVNTTSSIPSSEPMGATWTRGDGSWAIPGPLPPSQYFAVVEKKSSRGVVCLSAESNSRYF